MYNLSLTACSFLLKKRHTAHKYYNLNDPIPALIGEDEIPYEIIDLFESFFSAYSESVENEENKRTFRCEYMASNQGAGEGYRYLYCIIQSGTYGSTSKVENPETGEVKYVIQPDEPVVKPFFFYIVIPNNTPQTTVQKGMFYFQNVGPFGVKTITTECMKKYFSEHYNLTLECRSISPKLFLDRMITQTNLKKLILINNNKSRDLSDNQYFGYGEETKILGKLNFLARGWAGLKEKINHFANNKAGLFEIENGMYNKVKVKLKVGGYDRIIDLHNLENLSIIEPIPDTIRQEDGHPNKEALLNHLENVTKEYLSEMVLQVN